MLSAPETLVTDVVDVIVTAVNLRHKNREEIKAETPLFANGLELDSLDVLEIVVALEKRFDIKIENAEEGKRIFQTIGTVADFVHSKRASA